MRLHGKGGKERLVPLGSLRPRGGPAYLVRARPALAAAGVGTPALLPQQARRAAVPAERLGGAPQPRPSRPASASACQPAHAAALLRHPPARRRRRRPRRPGAARARLGDHDPDLHHGHRRSGCARSTRRAAPAGPLNGTGERSAGHRREPSRGAGGPWRGRCLEAPAPPRLGRRDQREADRTVRRHRSETPVSSEVTTPRPTSTTDQTQRTCPAPRTPARDQLGSDRASDARLRRAPRR